MDTDIPKEFLDPKSRWFWWWRYETWETVFDPETHLTRTVYDKELPSPAPRVPHYYLTRNKRKLAWARDRLRRIDAGWSDYELARRVADWDPVKKRWIRRVPRWPPINQLDPHSRDLLTPTTAPFRPVSWLVVELLDRFDVLHQDNFNPSQRSNMSKARRKALKAYARILALVRKRGLPD